MGFSLGSNEWREDQGGDVGFGGDLESLWGLLWDKRGSLRLEEVMLGLREIWGLFGVSLGFSLGSNGQLEAGGGGVGFGRFGVSLGFALG